MTLMRHRIPLQPAGRTGNLASIPWSSAIRKSEIQKPQLSRQPRRQHQNLPPIATPMPMLATAAPTLAPSTTPTNTLNGKAATPQREIFPDTGLTRQYQSIRLVSFKPCRNATTRGAESAGVVLRRNPITGIAGCCARAASGNAITPPSMLINSRRFTRSPRRRGRAVCREFGPPAPWRS
jgi:hypothetical protein